MSFKCAIRVCYDGRELLRMLSVKSKGRLSSCLLIKITEDNDRQNNEFKLIFMVTGRYYRYRHEHTWSVLKEHINGKLRDGL